MVQQEVVPVRVPLVGLERVQLAPSAVGPGEMVVAEPVVAPPVVVTWREAEEVAGPR
jgi:hypothetical protein